MFIFQQEGDLKLLVGSRSVQSISDTAAKSQVITSLDAFRSDTIAVAVANSGSFGGGTLLLDDLMQLLGNYVLCLVQGGGVLRWQASSDHVDLLPSINIHEGLLLLNR